MTESAHLKPAGGKDLVVKRKSTISELPTQSDPTDTGGLGLALRPGSTHRSHVQYLTTLATLIISPSDANQYCNRAAQVCLNPIELPSPIRTIHGR